MLQPLRGWLLLCLCLLCVACAPGGEAPLRVGTNIWLGYEPFYVARQAGSLPENVRLVEYASASEVLSAFRSRAIEAAAVTLDEAISLAENDNSLRIGLMLDTSNAADALVARPGIRRLSELKGRTIGVESLAVGAYLLGRALQRADLSVHDVRIVPTPLDQHESAFSRAEVDAVVTFYPVLAHLRERGGEVLFDSRAMPGEIVDVLVYREEQHKQHGKALQALALAWFDGVGRVADRQPQAMLTMAHRQKLSPRMLDEALGLLEFQDITRNRSALLGAHPGLAPVFGRLSLGMRELGLINRPLEPVNHLDSRIVEDLPG